MAGALPRKPEEFQHIDGTTIAIIASMWHDNCVQAMIDRAKSELERLGVRRIDVHRLPGSYELPLAANFIFSSDPTVDAIIGFGVVLKGATTHDSTVITEVVSGFSRVMHQHGKPIINEVIGVVDMKDAEKRSGTDNWNKGLEAAFAVSETLAWRRKLTEESSRRG